jgi:hypothetical protein
MHFLPSAFFFAAAKNIEDVELCKFVLLNKVASFSHISCKKIGALVFFRSVESNERSLGQRKSFISDT